MRKNSRRATPIALVFEDNPERAKDITSRISKSLGQHVQVLSFIDEVPARMEKEAIEDILSRVLQSDTYVKGNIGLIVCDKALERFDKLRVTSEAVVSSVAKRLGIPICLYERGGGELGGSLQYRKPWEKGAIVVDIDSPTSGQECASLYRGFQSIADGLARITDDKFRKMTPAEVLARILGKPEETDRMALYGAGEQGILAELLEFYDANRGAVKGLREKHYPRVLGNWLYTSILRFPGILVDEAACSSYLNIRPDDLAKPSIDRLFANAKYKGPFGSYRSWWWRRDLDSILAKAQCATGLQYVQKRTMKARPCLCCENTDGTHPAGFHCMITGKPVCEKHSRGGISWFPSGADLARVWDREYKKIGPFLGLY